MVRHKGEECKIYHYEKDFNHHFSSVLLSWTVGFAASSVPELSTIQLVSGIGATFEARWYSNIAKRAECGRSTYNNSSDFVSMRLRANTGDGLEVSFTPAYGIRRSFGRLWFHEITFGPKIGMTTEYGLFLAPHIQYRIGLAF